MCASMHLRKEQRQNRVITIHVERALWRWKLFREMSRFFIQKLKLLKLLSKNCFDEKFKVHELKSYDQ